MENTIPAHEKLPPPTPVEAKDSEAFGPKSRAGALQLLVVKLRPVRHIPVPARYLISFALVVGSFFFRDFFGELSHYPFLLFFPAIILVSFIFDRGTGVFATVLSAVFAVYFFMEPYHSFAVESSSDKIALVFFFPVSLFMALIIEALRVTVDDLGKSNSELEESEARFQEIASAVDEIFWVYEPGENRFVYISPAFQRVWGITAEEVLSSSDAWLLTVHPEDRERVRRAFYIHVMEGVLYDETYRIVRPDGEVRWIHARAKASRHKNDKDFRLVGVAADITLLKKAQENMQNLNKGLENLVNEKTVQVRSTEEKLHQAQKMEAVGRAISIMAHDFNNVLNPIMGAVELLKFRLTSPDEKTRKLLDMIFNVTMSGKTMVEDILAFSRRQDPEPAAVDIAALIRENEALIRQSAQGAAFDFRIDENLPAAYVDPGLLKRALLNLVVNARDAMPMGGVITIRVHAARLEGTEGMGSDEALPGEYIHMTIKDTGMGMTEEVKQKVFEPFFTTKPVGQGTGLGLAMVMDFIRKSRGRIQVESKPGRGTAVCLYFPVIQGV